MSNALRHSISRVLPTDVRLFVRRFQHRGVNRRCPLCKSSVNEFWDFGVPLDIVEKRQIVGALPLPDDICPVCWGASRARLIALYLDFAAKSAGGILRLLHIAPDIGVYYWVRNRSEFDYVACDLEPERYTIVPHVQKADINCLPYKDGTFDHVICSHVLEHIPDDQKAMSEIKRVLKPGGAALLMVPEALVGDDTDEDVTLSDPRQREERFGQNDHVRLYSRKDFVARLVASGFDVTGFDGFSDRPKKAKEWRLNPLERLWVARRPS